MSRQSTTACFCILEHVSIDTSGNFCSVILEAIFVDFKKLMSRTSFDVECQINFASKNVKILCAKLLTV